jgi:lipoate synthase
MSKNSQKANYQQSLEWLKWAKSKYPTLKRKKSKPLYRVEE